MMWCPLADDIKSMIAKQVANISGGQVSAAKMESMDQPIPKKALKSILKRVKSPTGVQGKCTNLIRDTARKRRKSTISERTVQSVCRQ